MKSRTYFIILLVLIIHIVIGYYFLIKWGRGEYTKKIPAYTGIITKIVSEDYACGKHKRYTCTKYVIFLDDIPFSATKEEFNTAVKGSTFTTYVYRDNSPYYANYFMFSSFPLNFITIFFLGYGIVYSDSKRKEE